MMVNPAAMAAELPVPPLREDLRLGEAAAGADGEPTWMIQDTVVNRFYRIGWFEFECLLRWGQSPRRISEQIASQTALKPDADQVLQFRQFLEQHQLLRPGDDAVDRLRQRSEGNPWLTWKGWLHHYLFFRVPLVRPQRLLQSLARRLDGLFHPFTAWLVVALTLLGLVMVAHQWDTFKNAVIESFSPEGLLGFALALIVGKTLHEMGHALTATRLGLKVAHMGIAFVVLWPMLYTDTGEAWKLRSSRARLAIASAGILTELGLAGLATLGWALSEPGALRDAFFYLATTAWVLSLALNASPFMRFDGYFILSDLIDFPNLHERAQAQAKVAIRRRLLGLKEPWPEPFRPRERRLLIAFAIATWVYRLIIFAGIAVAVYLFFFKALGIFLFAVEVSWFILRPIWREMQHWWQARQGIPTSRGWVLGALLGGLIVLLALPWQTQVHGWGMARAERQLRVFAPYPAQLREIHPVGTVAAGQTLVTLGHPDVDEKLRRSEAGARGYDARLLGLLADPGGLGEEAALRQRLGVELQEGSAARSEIERLHLQAPFAGLWRDVDPQWSSGQWIGTRESIGVLYDPSSWQVDAYVKPDEVHRIEPGASVRFYPEGQFTPIDGKVIAIGTTRTAQLESPMLSNRHGGPLPTAKTGKELTPTPALFHVLVQLSAAPPAQQETRGQVQVEGARRSVLIEGLTRLAAVLRRESGF
ncbi:HlyD family efflux transporter periplasmic adaptor subunit [Variovorax dokdonensis]|uniref:HlyD family efflux transporter periplasmic adaptor subunit n=1 Tax=Variovorax dokdonensis TaxID=344883 RepID=A0ABT7N8S7_9BURK|nr:site-2 protease family protein [Variovorax dokdonensis]MDM0044351.1 HlyD family efflux transporter periplasmic adaptor subunit [Variovorax dokdonensis]